MDNFDLRNFLYNNSLLKEDKYDDELKASFQKDLPTFVSDLKADLSDENAAANLDGSSDGDKDDDKFGAPQNTNLKCIKMQPSQNQIGFDDSVMGNITDKYNSLEGILKGKTSFPNPVVLYPGGSKGYYIVDGHHRWSAAYTANPECEINVSIIPKKKGFDIEMVLKAFQAAIALKTGKVPSNPMSGPNLLQGVSYAEVLKKVNDNLTDKAKDVWAANGYSDNESIAKLLHSNIEKMAAAGSAPNSVERAFMPQTDEEGSTKNKIDALAAGEVNVTEPFEENKKSLIKNIIKEEILKVLNEQKSK